MREVFSSPAVVDGVVYVGSDDGNLYALDAASGEQRWAFATGEAVWLLLRRWWTASSTWAATMATSTPLDAASGRAALGVRHGRVTAVESSPAVVDGVVYVGSGDASHVGKGNVYAIDAASGAQRWSFAAGDVVLSSPAVVDGVVYVGSGRVVGASESNVYALDAASGEQRWAFLTGGTVFASPVVVDGVVYVGSWDHNLYALDAASGEQRWSFTTGDPVTSSPAVVDGIVYFGSEDSKLYALESAPAGTPTAATPTS